MGKQPGRHTDWLCNRRGLIAAAGATVRDRADIAGGYGSRCQSRDTVTGKQGTLFAGDEPSNVFAYARRAVWLQR